MWSQIFSWAAIAGLSSAMIRVIAINIVLLFMIFFLYSFISLGVLSLQMMENATLIQMENMTNLMSRYS